MTLSSAATRRPVSVSWHVELSQSRLIFSTTCPRSGRSRSDGQTTLAQSALWETGHANTRLTPRTINTSGAERLAAALRPLHAE